MPTGKESNGKSSSTQKSSGKTVNATEQRTAKYVERYVKPKTGSANAKPPTGTGGGSTGDKET